MKRLALLFACLSVSPAFAKKSTPAPSENVTYASGSEKVTGYLARPSSSGKHPALIVIHEWWGLNDMIRDKARHFADEGYVALAVDLYRGKSTADPDVAHQLMRGLPEDRAARDLDAAFKYLASRPDVDATKIGSIGWCMGGGYSLQTAIEEPKLAAAVIYYGRLVTDPATIARIKAPLLGNYGADDQGIPPDAVKAFEEAARKAGVDYDFQIYDGVGHGFASHPDKPTPQSKDADARTEEFLAKHLKK